MTVIYEANDGKRFFSEDACEDYERKLEAKKAIGLIYGMTNDEEEILFSDFNFCDDVKVLYLVNYEAVELFIDRCENEGISFDGIDDPGVYMWNDEQYIPIPRMIKEHNDEIEKLNKLIFTISSKATSK